MRHIASRLTSVRVVGLATLAAAAGAVVLTSGGTAVAATTVSAPTIASSFTPAEIGVTGSSTITYTITNPNASGSLYNIAFTDTLPAYASIDDPVNLTNSGCGTPSIGAGAGNGGVGATGITVKAGTPCTIGVSIVGNGVGDTTDTLSSLTYQASATGADLTAPSTSETAATLDVLADPTVTVTTPKKNAKYTYGEKVKANFACTAASDATGSLLSGCLATDSVTGATINAGQDLDTTTPGVHSLEISAFDTLGDETDATVNYTVLPDNIFTLKSWKAAKNGAVTLGLKVPGAGTLKLAEFHGSKQVATATVKTAQAKSLSTELKLTSAGSALLTADSKLKVTLKITFTPKGGTAHSVVKAITLS